MIYCTMLRNYFNTVARSTFYDFLHIYIAVGEVLTVEPVPKKSDLKKCTIDVSGDGSGITVVTNAKYIAEGWRVVVAMQNAIVPAGADPEEDSNVIIVKKTAVVRSNVGVFLHQQTTNIHNVYKCHLYRLTFNLIQF